MPAGKTYIRVASQTLSSTSATVTFSNIPQNFTDLVLVMSPAIQTSQANGIRIRLGNTTVDTGSSYSTTHLIGNGSSASSQRDTNGTSIILSWNNAPNSSLGIMNAICNFQNYSNGSINKTMIFRTNNANQSTEATAALWRQTSPINIIELSTSGGATNQFTPGSIFMLYGIECAKNPYAEGGDIVVTDGTFWYHAFTTSGRFVPDTNLTADVLTVAGGGGGGTNRGGGGGAGGLVYRSSQSILGSVGYAVTVGGGGVGGGIGGAGNSGNGSDSQFGSLDSASGGGRGGSSQQAGFAGGSGGGGGNEVDSNPTPAAGAGNTPSRTPSQGNNGGTCAASGTKIWNAGGGGGAGAVGGTGFDFTGGNGGAGSSSYSSWGFATGTGQNVGGTYFYAGGGAAGGMTNGGTGGSGGGGRGESATSNNSTAGLASTGGGGGATWDTSNAAKNGGSGVVIVRYPV